MPMPKVAPMARTVFHDRFADRHPDDGANGQVEYKKTTMTTRFPAAVVALDVPLLPSDDTTPPVWIARQATVVEPFAFELIDLVETIDGICDTIGVILDGLASDRCS